MKLSKGIIIAEQYLLLRQLGHGSFGEVWLAHHQLADIDVAIKFYGAFDMKGLDEFRAEFKLAYQLRHPNLLNINNFDVYDNYPYLVMPYCANGSVSRQIGHMTEEDIWKFASDVSAGLAYLHSQHPPIIHQDIKPDNILITADGRYVVSDFGISRSLRTKMSATNNTSSSGTIAYMGPERFSEKPVIVLASDIWSLGMTLYELMSGDVMWEGMGGCVQLSGARVTVMDQHFSPELRQLVTACLARQTWDLPTAEQVYNYAEAHLHGRQLPALTNNPIMPPVRQETVPHMQQPEHFSYKSTDVPNNTAALNTIAGSLLPSGWTWKRIIIGVAAALLSICLISSIAIIFSNIREEQRFVECQTAEDLENFIADYPNSPYAETARKRIISLKAATETVQPGIETAEESLQQERYMEEPPHTNMSAPARKKVPVKSSAPQNHRSTKSVASDKADDAAFYNCVTSGDFHNYITNFPNGRHRDAAIRALTNLLKSEGGNAIPTKSLNDRPINTSSRHSPHKSERPSRNFRNHRPRH